jgi:hypothetical protein
MLMIRRKQEHWVRITHVKSGEVLEIQIKEVLKIGSVFTVTLAIRDDPRNFEIAKPVRSGESRPEAPP